MSTKIILLIGASAVVLVFIVYAVIINNRRFAGRRRRYNKDLHSDVGDLSLSGRSWLRRRGEHPEDFRRRGA